MSWWYIRQRQVLSAASCKCFCCCNVIPPSSYRHTSPTNLQGPSHHRLTTTSRSTSEVRSHHTNPRNSSQFPCRKQYNIPSVNLFEVCPPPDDMHKNCKTCEQHFLTRGADQSIVSRSFTRPSEDHAERLLSDALLTTRVDLKHIKSVICSRGDVILHRWKKYGQAKRAKLLNTASPGVFGPPSREPTAYAGPLNTKVGHFHAASQGPRPTDLRTIT